MSLLKKWFGPQTIGFAIHVALIALPAWGLLPVPQLTALFNQLSPFLISRLLGFIGTLLVIGMGILYAPTIFRRNLVPFALAMMSAGYVLLFIGAYLDVFPRSLMSFMSFCIGCGNASSFLMWIRVFSEEDIADAKRQIVTGSALMSVIYLLFSITSSIPALAVLLFVCIGVNALLLQRCLRRKTDLIKEEKQQVLPKEGMVKSLFSSAWRYVLCIAAIGYASGAARALVPQTAEHNLFLNYALMTSMLVSALILLILWEGMKKNFSFRGSYSVLLILVTTFYLLLTVFDQEYRVLLAGFCFCAFSVVSMFMIISCLEIGRFKGIDPVAVFGLFAACVYFLETSGKLLGGIAGAGMGATQAFIIAMVAIYLLSFAGVVVNQLKRGNDDFDPISLSIEKALPTKQDNHQAVQSYQVKSGTAERMIDEKSFLQPVIVYQDTIPKYCKSLKEIFRLSNRETEVLELIVRGRDIARIAEALYVSQNTICTHTKNLYKKMDVHNRQEVLDLFEELRNSTKTISQSM